jgi:hypothetical protein
MLRLGSTKQIPTLLCLSALPFLLSHCTHHTPTPTPMSNPMTLESVDTTHVTSVVLIGHMHVNLSTQLQHDHLSFTIPKNDIDHTQISIHNGTLFIDNTHNRSMPTHYQLTIGSTLNELSVHGDVSVSSEHLDTQKLHIIDASNGEVNLKGQMDIQRIDATEHSHLSIAWVNSPKLVILADKDAQVTLAGIAKEVYIHLDGNASLDAQYLRSNAITISSYHTSQANLMPLDSFQGFAHDSSTVYLFHKPTFMNQHTFEMGNIFMKTYRP